MRFVLIDEILELEPGRRIVARRRIDPADDYFADHFPGFPVVPGVLLTEMMAQAGGKCLDAESRPRGKAMLAQIRSASFRRWVRPGEEARISVEVHSNGDQVATAAGRVEVGGARAAGAELLFSFVPQGRFAPDYRDEVLERWRALQGRGGGR